MLTLQDVELLATLLTRTPVSSVEAQWTNTILNRLRALAIEAEVALDKPTDSVVE